MKDIWRSRSRNLARWPLAAVLAAALIVAVVLASWLARERRELQGNVRELRRALLETELTLAQAQESIGEAEQRLDVERERSRVASANRRALSREVRAAHALLAALQRPRDTLTDERLELAVLRGSYPRASRLVATSRDGTVERVLLRPPWRVNEFVWVRGGDGLWVRTRRYDLRLRRDGALVPNPLRREPCSESNAPPHEVARNGTFLVEGETNYYLCRPGTHPTTLLEDEGGEATLSPDGRTVAFVEQQWSSTAAWYRVLIKDVKTGVSRPLNGSWSRDEIRDLEWSPDARTLLFVSSARRGGIVFRISLGDASGRVERLLVNASSPDWSPDGTLIAFERMRAGRTQIYVANAGGANVRLLTRAGADSWSPRWRPRG